MVGPTSEQENLCPHSDGPPKSATCVFFWLPRWFPKKGEKKGNACSLLNTSYNVVTKQFISKICIQYNFLNRSIENRDPLQLVGNTFNFGHCNTKISYYNKYFLKKNLIQLHLKKQSKQKKDKKKVYMESKTVMLINSVLMTTLILCRN